MTEIQKDNKNIANVPHLRFPGFTDEWEVKKLGEIAAFSNGKGHEKDIDENGIYILINSKFVSTDGNVIKRTNKQLIPLFCNQIVMVMSDLPNGKALAKCFYIDNNNLYTLNQRICSLTINEDDSKFIYYSINRNEFYLKFDDGVNQTNLKKAEVLDCPVYLPNLREQQKIASFLSLIEERIQTQIKIIEELKLLKNTLRKKIFSRELKFKDDIKNGFSKWENIPLGDIGEIITGKTPSTNDLSLWNGDVQFVTPTDISENKYQYSTERTIKKTEKLKILPEKTIMYTCIASIGKMSLSLKPCVTNQQINSIIPNSGFNNEFVYYAIANISEFIKSTQSSSTIPIINKNEFSKFKISVPSQEKQTKIANFLSSIDTKIDVETELLQKLEEQKKYLLQSLFI